MAITIVEQPTALSFSGNPVMFKVKSDRAIASAGTKAENGLLITKFEIGDKLIIDYNEHYLELDVVAVPDETGYTIPAIASGDFGKGLALLPYLKKNYYLFRDFSFTAADDTVYIKAKNIGSNYNIAARSEANYSITEGAGTDAGLSANFKILVELFFKASDETDYRSIYNEQINTDGLLSDELSMDISEKLDAALLHDIPDFNETQITRCTKSKGTYYLQFTEVYGSPAWPKERLVTDVYHVAKGGLSYHGYAMADLLSWLNREPEPEFDRFLKQGSYEIPVRTNQPEYLHFMNLRATTTQILLSVHLTFRDGSTQDIFGDPLDIALYDKICIPTGYVYLGLTEHNPDLTLVSYQVRLLNQDQEPVSLPITYHLDYFYREMVRYFCYVSSLSGIDTLSTYGRATASMELSQEEAKRPRLANYRLTDGDYRQFNHKIRRGFKAVTNYVDKRQFDLLTDLFLSEHKFIVRTFRALPVSIEGKDLGKAVDLENLRAQEFEYRYNFEDDHYTEGDAEDNGAYIDELYLPESANNSQFTYTFPFILS